MATNAFRYVSSRRLFTSTTFYRIWIDDARPPFKEVALRAMRGVLCWKNLFALLLPYSLYHYYCHWDDIVSASFMARPVGGHPPSPTSSSPVYGWSVDDTCYHNLFVKGNESCAACTWSGHIPKIYFRNEELSLTVGADQRSTISVGVAPTAPACTVFITAWIEREDAIVPLRTLSLHDGSYELTGTVGKVGVYTLKVVGL